MTTTVLVSLLLLVFCIFPRLLSVINIYLSCDDCQPGKKLIKLANSGAEEQVYELQLLFMPLFRRHPRKPLAHFRLHIIYGFVNDI